jgi:hypothetical protein
MRSVLSRITAKSKMTFDFLQITLHEFIVDSVMRSPITFFMVCIFNVKNSGEIKCEAKINPMSKELRTSIVRSEIDIRSFINTDNLVSQGN